MLGKRNKKIFKGNFLKVLEKNKEKIGKIHRK